MIIVPVGLPGSGKTTYGQSIAGDGVEVIDFDELSKKYSLIEALQKVDWNTMDSDKDFYLDGLFITEEVQEEIANNFYDIKWLYFDTPRDECIKRDRNRVKSEGREKSSEAIIENAYIRRPEYYYTVKDNELKLTYAEYLLDTLDMERITYEEWSDGGTYGTCWDEDGPSELSADTPVPAVEVAEVQRLLQEYECYPLSPVLDNTIQDLATFDDAGEGDYYGGFEEKTRMTLDLSRVLEAILLYRYNMEPCSLEEAKISHPEMFL